ncbi:adenylate/guanylate cyclase domain-containing protein [Mesorhizobium sp. VK23B]|uniref:Adenylate/guanylate cyclase domain-containing protein n=1 Tax=Mesorhizobium dulcispinae TaxID=3072316 RepID=A0ABU4XGG0_9HYPH|nr:MULTISPECIES: adenylate/guanylate cyclase domain-containing protein [unclassified Mesorhizobium]MDX8467293.1 adenylate/guanylate cyclase domain-containing protein [Mesorhizobium sp. VK23B]MDX8473719.1 adenylate/guanylate cyclase domain-containing protein [Mesorhizobium sp. VK23A]
MDQERLLAAVLLADVVGSTPLYERIGDDAALRQVSDCLDAIREIVAQHGGDFIYSKGDDVLSLFERPEAALRAVCQINSQMTRAPLSARIGLHFGAVIRARGAVFGDVVNVTARLSTTANPGEVLISQSFFEALSAGSRGALRLLDKMAFKGKQELFDVYTLGSDDVALDTHVASRGTIIERRSAPPRQINLVIRYGDQLGSCRNNEFVTIGRSPECNIVVQRPWVSRHHATFTISNGKARLSSEARRAHLCRWDPAKKYSCAAKIFSSSAPASSRLDGDRPSATPRYFTTKLSQADPAGLVSRERLQAAAPLALPLPEGIQFAEAAGREL